ncbi:MAG TPA: protein-L-isoaspartate(D-aspartate) O-methyltransferase [Lentimicrobium sp.]|nr:protein-L-isoaspartate(D-aspartate) O-methyltransferase [Lentimicrobium sp.]
MTSNLVDTFRHKGLRKKLIDQIRNRGIKDERVLSAMEALPRHFFFDSGFLEYAYQDNAFPIGEGQTISQPYTVAYQTELLDVKKGDKVLEVGTGSGYQAGILYNMGAKVYSVERQKPLYIKAKELLPKIGCNVKVYFGDGYNGLSAFSPFDRIIVTAAAPFIPQKLIDQLKVGGKMVIPVNEGDIQVMTLLVKIDEQTNEITRHGYFRFVPLLEDKNHKS